jgi:hypothetical protein
VMVKMIVVNWWWGRSLQRVGKRSFKKLMSGGRILFYMNLCGNREPSMY